ncbi:aminopeptidase P family protein [Vaginella massiliensis]|uniref:aminopeptidase P family protein n=1 Tax=Vaginella massiliensis TaxID=1816680 RepID=UPI000838E8D1|nr:aminopeptidase P family protein [Vaginella massiliensis]
MNAIAQRLEALRQEMRQNKIQATIIPGTDPHASEYLAKHWQVRNWISGFTGSAGTAVVTLDKALLWTDSRYFIQAEIQLAGTGFELMKDRLPETPDIVTWLLNVLQENDTVGLDLRLFSHQTIVHYQQRFATKNIRIESINLIGAIWNDRPGLPQNPVMLFDTEFTGKTVAEKLASVRNKMSEQNADVLVISALDELAWLYNIRGNDIKFNPLVMAYAVVTKTEALLFIDQQKLDAASRSYIDQAQISLFDYQEITAYLENLAPQTSVWIDGQVLNQSLFECLPKTVRIVDLASPIKLLKSIKNETEIAGFRKAMIKDGVALTKFFKWLEEQVDSNSIIEYTVGEKLKELRQAQANFQGESFNTICGYGPNAAMNHYSAKKDSSSTIGRDEMLLIDSGGQYLEGTTDITRTLKLGKASDQEKRDYTLVLKGMIALSQAKFPKNTRGSQLDVLARQFLWQNAYNFGHGTGHGIGHFLCVHEGPQSIRMEENSTTLEPGMVISNEPGLYRDHAYGIRIENLILVKPFDQTVFGEFYEFETLTLCYIDQSLMDVELLTAEEIDWINRYHKMVFERLAPSLSNDEKAWLQNKCRTIAKN